MLRRLLHGEELEDHYSLFHALLYLCCHQLLSDEGHSRFEERRHQVLERVRVGNLRSPLYLHIDCRRSVHSLVPRLYSFELPADMCCEHYLLGLVAHFHRPRLCLLQTDPTNRDKPDPHHLQRVSSGSYNVRSVLRNMGLK